MKMTPGLQRSVETTAPKFLNLLLQQSAAWYLQKWTLKFHNVTLSAPYQAHITAFLYYHVGFLSNQHLFLPSFPRLEKLQLQLTYRAMDTQDPTQKSCKKSCSQSEVLCCFQGSLESFPSHMESMRTTTTNHYFCFYFQVPWYNPDLNCYQNLFHISHMLS